VAASTRVGNSLGAGSPKAAMIAGYVSPTLALGETKGKGRKRGRGRNEEESKVLR
jgi:hypothetical protein